MTLVAHKPLPPQAYLLECMDIDLSTGQLTWKRRPRTHFATDGARATWNTRYAGKLAFAAVTPRGYLHGAVNNELYFAHRIVWKLVHGDEPGEIDHIDGNPKNNAPSNLRIVTRLQNARNARLRSDNKSGHTGIFWDDKRSVWRAILGGKVLGQFKSKSSAVACRAAALVDAGYHPNHGRAPQ